MPRAYDLVMILYVVRHAKAIAKKNWHGDDLIRPLNTPGQQQSVEIANSLRTRDIEFAFSSPSLRCRQTLDPLVSDIEIPIEDAVLLGDRKSGPRWPPFADPDDDHKTMAWMGRRSLCFVDELADRFTNSSVVICSHGDVIPVLLDLLFIRDDVAPKKFGNAKGSTWTLTFNGPKLHKAQYHPAP